VAGSAASAVDYPCSLIL